MIVISRHTHYLVWGSMEMPKPMLGRRFYLSLLVREGALLGLEVWVSGFLQSCKVGLML